MAPEFVDWLRRNNRSSVCVVSPHFDDAVYSAHTVLAMQELDKRVVATIVTRGTVGMVTAWVQLVGFPDTHTEHVARAGEDIGTLKEMGVHAVHLGAESDNPGSLSAAVDMFAAKFLDRPERWAFLLPAGAGMRLGRLRRSWRRLTKHPTAGVAHPEHILSRDLVRRCLVGVSGALWGYYAENPYLLFDDAARLQRHLEDLDGERLRCVTCIPDVPAKLHCAEGYSSQAEVLLGRSHVERMVFASRAELYFLREARA